jgi:hypothetical protein
LPAGFARDHRSACYYHSNNEPEPTLSFLTVALDEYLPEPSPSTAQYPVINYHGVGMTINQLSG